MFQRRSIPSTIVVFGRGTIRTGDHYQLTVAARNRVDAAVAYVRANQAVYAAAPPTIIFSGGWSAAAAGIAEPPRADREAALMRDYAATLATDLFTTEIEDESTSTLHDVLLLCQRAIESQRRFNRQNPLGLVAQRGHLHRIVFLVRRIMRLRRRALVVIKAPGPDQRSAGLPEWLLTVVYRFLFLGDPTEPGLLKREAALVRVLDSLRRRTQG